MYLLLGDSSELLVLAQDSNTAETLSEQAGTKALQGVKSTINALPQPNPLSLDKVISLTLSTYLSEGFK